jgi:hypothetical protein
MISRKENIFSSQDKEMADLNIDQETRWDGFLAIFTRRHPGLDPGSRCLVSDVLQSPLSRAKKKLDPGSSPG